MKNTSEIVDIGKKGRIVSSGAKKYIYANLIIICTENVKCNLLMRH